MAFKKLKLWFDADLATSLAQKIEKVYPNFDSAAFINYVISKIATLELKDRIEVFTDGFQHFLTDNYVENAKVLAAILGEENQEETGMFLNYYWMMPIAKYVEKYGLDHFDVSMDLIKEITKRNTSEYAIRPFLNLSSINKKTID